MVDGLQISNQMAVAMARMLRSGETVFHGVASPLPMVAILLARQTHAPNLTYLNIAGSVNPRPTRLPESTVDPLLLGGTAGYFPLAEVFDLAARGGLDTAFLSGVQIDGRGRINMSAIGDYQHPKVRLPGGAGSTFLLQTARRVILWRTRHDTRTLVSKVSFATGSGRVEKVVTPLCIFSLAQGQLEVESIHPYATPDQVREHTGFPVKVDDGTPRTPAPTPAELAALQSVDPAGVRLIEF